MSNLSNVLSRGLSSGNSGSEDLLASSACVVPEGMGACPSTLRSDVKCLPPSLEREKPRPC